MTKEIICSAKLRERENYFKAKTSLVKASLGSFIKYVRKIFRKTNISIPLIGTRTSAYQGVKNVSFTENFAYYDRDPHHERVNQFTYLNLFNFFFIVSSYDPRINKRDNDTRHQQC